jgi:hypothetical protein
MSRLIVLLLVLAAAVPAYEAPLIINNLSGNSTVIINPSLGSMTLYNIQDGQLTRAASTNFLADMVPLGVITADVDGQGVTALQTGSANNQPTAEAFMQVLGKLGTAKAEKEAGLKSLAERARAAEREFWGKEPAYDGVVRAALAQNYLMVAIPAKHALLVYDVTAANFEMVAWHNYGPELYLPHVFGSNPSPAEILQELPADVQEERKKELQAQIEAMTESANQAIALKPSELYIFAGPGERFAVFDLANTHLMAYEYNGRALVLRGIRNVEVDLLIPTAFRSTPDIAEIYKQWTKDRARQGFLASLGMDKDLISFQLYVESKQQTAQSPKAGSPFQANVVPNTGDLVLDFIDKRKAIVYRFAGGEPTMDLKSLRDYTLDAGIALLDAEYKSTVMASQLLAGAKKANKPRTALLTLISALKLDPTQYRAIEKDKGLVKKVEGEPGYQEMMEDAIKRATDIEKAREERKKEAEERRKKKAGGGK